MIRFKKEPFNVQAHYKEFCAASEAAVTAYDLGESVFDNPVDAVEHVRSRCRKTEFVIPRQITILLLRENGWTFPALSSVFGFKENATPQHHVRRLRDEIKVSKLRKREYSYAKLLYEENLNVLPDDL